MKKMYIRDGRAPVPSDDRTSRLMSSIKAKNTKPELFVRKALWERNIRGYRLHWKKAAGKPDLAFPKRKLAIFVHGCFWHRCPHCSPPLPKSHSIFWQEKFDKNVERDIKKLDLLRKDGWQVIVLWECEIKKDVSKSVMKIQELIDKQNG